MSEVIPELIPMAQSPKNQNKFLKLFKSHNYYFKILEAWSLKLNSKATVQGPERQYTRHHLSCSYGVYDPALMLYYWSYPSQ